MDFVRHKLGKPSRQDIKLFREAFDELDEELDADEENFTPMYELSKQAFPGTIERTDFYTYENHASVMCCFF